MKKLILRTIVFFVADVIVLTTVWRHAHWSVALLLSILIYRLFLNDFMEDAELYEDSLTDEQLRGVERGCLVRTR